MENRLRRIFAIRTSEAGLSHLLLILTLAAAVRIPAMLDFSKTPFFTHNRLDAAVYHGMAVSFANGGDLWGFEVVHMSPLYSGLLGLIYTAFGPSPWPPRIFQLALGLATIALIFGACRRLFAPRWALLGGVIAALYGPSMFFEHQISVATLGMFLSAAFIFAAIFAFERPERGIKRWAVVGAVWGLGVLARPNALLLGIPLMYLVFVSEKRFRFQRAAAVLAAGALVIAPVTLRNYMAAGEAVLVTDAGGMNFYIGNGPDANGAFNIPKAAPGASNAPAQFREFKRVAEQDLGRKLTSKETDAYWYAKTFDHIRKNPGQWIALLAKKALLFLHPRELSSSHNYDFHRRLNPTLALPFIQYGILAVFGVFGTILMLFSRIPEMRFVSLAAVVSFASLVGFFILDHYRIIVVPAFVVASVCSVARLLEWLKAKYWPGVVAAGAFAAAMFFLGTISFFEPNTADEYFKLGYAHHTQKNAKKAAEAYGEALKLDPNNVSALKNFAFLLEAEGLDEQALGLWRRLFSAADKAGLSDYRDTARERIQALVSKAKKGP